MMPVPRGNSQITRWELEPRMVSPRREGLRRYEGRVSIRRGHNWLARLCSAVTGMPPAMSEAPLIKKPGVQ